MAIKFELQQWACLYDCCVNYKNKTFTHCKWVSVSIYYLPMTNRVLCSFLYAFVFVLYFYLTWLIDWNESNIDIIWPKYTREKMADCINNKYTHSLSIYISAHVQGQINKPEWGDFYFYSQSFVQLMHVKCVIIFGPVAFGSDSRFTFVTFIN